MKDRSTAVYVLLFCIMLILGWMFAVYSPLRTELRSAEGLLSRQMNRITTRTALPDVPEMSPKQLQKGLDILYQRHAELRDRVDALEAKFVNLRSADGLRQLRLEIAQIAEASGLDVKRFGVMAKDGEITDSNGALRNQIRQPYGRPVLSFEATGSFSQISNFVDQLGKASHSVGVLSLALEAPEFKDMIDNPKSAHLLGIKLEMAL